MNSQIYNFFRKAFDGQKNKLPLTGKLLFFALLLSFVLFSTVNKFVPASSLHLGSQNAKLQDFKKDPNKNTYEVFGFAPYWTLNKLDNVNFNVLTTLAYFGLSVQIDGNVDVTDSGYQKFYSDEATQLFNKAHQNGTRVVATITQMDNASILSFLDDLQAQDRAIDNIVGIVESRGIDGINVDFEYSGDPGDAYRQQFSSFVGKLSKTMHTRMPGSNLTVSVYASAAKFPKIYDLATLSRETDGIFMMAYDFATAGSASAMPTSPLYGFKEGKYWYDVSTAVDDFLTQMPKEKLILGLPWYGYDYPVASPEVKAQRDYGYYTYYWYKGRQYSRFVARSQAYSSTYSLAKNGITPDQTGWDETAEVGWIAYQGNDGWRMMFLDDSQSLGIKYDFAKQKGLGGVGMWALGFDAGNTELWTLLEDKFGKKLVASNI